MSAPKHRLRMLPPPTDDELDTRPGSFFDENDDLRQTRATVSPDTLKRVDEALRWHEKRAKERAS